MVLVASYVTVTSAPDKAFPFSSTRFPLISEVVELEKADDEKTRNKDKVNFFKLFIIDIPSLYIRIKILYR